MQISKQSRGSNEIEFICRRFIIGMLCGWFLAIPVASEAAELKPETVRTWDAYVETANLQMRERTQKTFLWVDESPERIQRVHDGEILVSSVGQRNPKSVPSGLIHDWIGAAFIPNVRLEDVVAAARDYDQYKNFYQPNVVDSKGLGSSGNCDKYSMRVVNKEVVAETALDAEYQACYLQLDAKLGTASDTLRDCRRSEAMAGAMSRTFRRARAAAISGGFIVSLGLKREMVGSMSSLRRWRSAGTFRLQFVGWFLP